jgi:hypothetical protein
METARWYMEVSYGPGYAKDMVDMLGPFNTQTDAWNAVRDHANNSVAKVLNYRPRQIPHDTFTVKKRRRASRV